VSPLRRSRWIVAACAAALLATVASSPSAGAAGPGNRIRLGEGGGPARTGFLDACLDVAREPAQFRCYTRGLLARIEATGDPANELPLLDKRVRRAGGFVADNCHMIMHVVGRTYARRHHVTLVNLQRFVPRSNDPTCSGGFGMGLVMYLGPRIAALGPQGAARACLGLPTRFRRYTCIHGLGHAYRRVYSGHLHNGELRFALTACARLGPRLRPDCSQGAFHDYWISLRGADGTTRPRHAQTARMLCARQDASLVRACWFRYFLENPPRHRITIGHGILSLCRGLTGLQRSGCISAASLIVSSDPFEQMDVCRQLPNADIVDCVRALAVQAVAGKPRQEMRLIRMCSEVAKSARPGCFAWLGRTLSIVSNGSFRASCSTFRLRGRREACTAGTRRTEAPLVTFS
jgi:hypothetical protein